MSAVVKNSLKSMMPRHHRFNHMPDLPDFPEELEIEMQKRDPRKLMSQIVTFQYESNSALLSSVYKAIEDGILT